MEKKDRAGFVTLEYVVQQFMLFRGEQSLHNFPKYYQMALKGYKELTYDVYGAVKVCIKEIAVNSTVDLPSDYLNYIRIGVTNENRVAWLGLNTDLVITRCDKLIQGNEGAHYNFGIPPAFGWTGYQYADGGLYGLGGGNNVFGYYNIDADNDKILLSSEVKGSILIEYISSGIDEGGDIFVPVFTEEAILAYLYWRSIVYNPRISAGDKQVAKMDYNGEKSNAVARKNGFTASELLQTLRKNNKATSKF